MTAYLLIDTCNWMETATKYPDLLPKLSGLVEGGRVKLLVPETVRQEWDRHKQDKIVARLVQSFDGRLKSAKSLHKKWGGVLSEQMLADWTQVLHQLGEERSEVDANAQDRILAVERLFDHPDTVILPITDQVKARAADLALDKKAPFGEKNSMADAVIFLSGLHYVTEESIDELMFVSANKADFAQEEGLHPELQELSGHITVRFFFAVGQAINAIQEGLVSADSIQRIELSMAVSAILEHNKRVMESVVRAIGTSRLTVMHLTAVDKALANIDLSAINAFVESNERVMESAVSAIDSGRLAAMHLSAVDTALANIDLGAVNAFLESNKRVMESAVSAIDVGRLAAMHLSAVDTALANIDPITTQRLLDRLAATGKALEEMSRNDADPREVSLPGTPEHDKIGERESSAEGED